MKKLALPLLISAFVLSGPFACAADKLSDDEKAATETKATTEAKPAADEKPSYKDEAVRHYNRAHDLHKQGFYNQAITEYKAATSADERMEQAWTNLGLIYAAQKNFPKAMDAFKKSLAINPNRVNALNGLGTIYYAKGKTAEAMEYWRKAIEIDPKFASAYFNMGNALENEKDLKPAIDAYVSAMDINPKLADAYYHVGTIYAKQKHPAQARVLLSRAIELQPAGEFVRDAKSIIARMEAEKTDSADAPEVKMNIMAPPSASTN